MQKIFAGKKIYCFCIKEKKILRNENKNRSS